MTHAPDDASHAARPVQLAIRSMLVLGFACTLFGAVFVVEFGVFNTFVRFRPWFTLLGMLLWLGPGLLFLWCGQSMENHSSSNAAAVALATTVFQALGASALLYASLTFSPVTVLPIVLCVTWIIALGDCVRHLIRARRFLATATGPMRGFDAVVTPKPVIPVTSEE